MIYGIINAFKRFSLVASVRRAPAKLAPADCAEPIVRPADDVPARAEPIWDEALFDDASPPIGPESRALANELSKSSTALSELRALLGEIAAIAPMSAETRFAEAEVNFAWQDDALFEGEAMQAVSGRLVPLEGETTFLFEETGPVDAWNLGETVPSEVSRAA